MNSCSPRSPKLVNYSMRNQSRGTSFDGRCRCGKPSEMEIPLFLSHLASCCFAVSQGCPERPEPRNKCNSRVLPLVSMFPGMAFCINSGTCILFIFLHPPSSVFFSFTRVSIASKHDAALDLVFCSHFGLCRLCRSLYLSRR